MCLDRKKGERGYAILEQLNSSLKNVTVLLKVKGVQDAGNCVPCMFGGSAF
jgi:hypothetical protein